MTQDSTPDLGSSSFLVIEDNSVALKMAATILSDLGAKDTASASDGLEALAHLERADPAPGVLQVDLTMPGMGGVEFMRELGEQGYEGSAVLVSGADDATLKVAASLAKYRGAKVLGYVVKPVTHKALGDILGGSLGD